MKSNIVTIEKWYSDNSIYYWIVDIDGEPIDGFSKKYMAIDAIKRWGLIRLDKSIKVKK